MSSRTEDARTEATEWLIRLDAGSADIAAFEAWRDADPRHRVAYAETLALWESLGRLERIEEPAREDRPLLARRQLLRAAACVMPVLAGAGLAWQLLDGPAYASTGVGEQRRFSPVPGLLVTLNTSSRIGWERQDGYCRVWLEQGEAALAIDGIDLRHAVFHCGERTFLLGAGEYNVRRDDSASSQVLILSGTARLARQAASARRITAGRGERIAFSPAIVKVELAPANAVQAASAWPQGEVVFDGETLGEAIAEYNRYLDRKLVIKDPGVKTMRIGGRFETLRPASFLAAIEKSFGLRALEQPDRILIERKSPVG